MTLKTTFGQEIFTIPWDGTTPWGKKMPYDPDGLFQDEKGNIWYIINDGRGLSAMWCSAEKLEHHVHHLQQIAAR